MTVHLIVLSHGKANAIDGDFVSFVSRELDLAVESGKTAVVLTGREGFFSAGLNLKELPDSREEMGAFLDDFEELNRKLLELPLPLVV
ncbi:MAG: enoyl-CoA hydratase-related protein, partial [Vicinamibacteria bacterium]